MKTGVDGIALSRDGDWIYFGAMNHDTVYRVPSAVLQDPTADAATALVEVGKKPLSDGFSIDDADRLYVTDVEHQGIAALDPDGTLTTLIRDDRVRWADGLSFGPDGWLYLADSAIPHLILQSENHHAAHAPYHIWRFKPGGIATPGQ